MKIKVDRKYLVGYVILFLGVAIILREYIGGRSLWVDEAMLALNMERPFSELIKPLDYNQTAPILFLFLSRFFTLIFGISDYSLRITPLLFGLGSLYVFFLISKKVLKPPAAAISMLLFILSYRLIYYANEFKQYSADVFFSLLFLYLFILIKEDGFSIKKGIGIAAVGLAAVWFSFSAVLVVMLYAAAALIWLIKSRNRKGAIFTAAAAVLWGLNILWLYVSVYLGNPNFSFEPLHNYWMEGFMPFPPVNLEEVLWLPKTIKGFFVYITNTDTIFTGRFPVIIDVYAYLFMAFFLLGTVYLARNKKGYLALYVWGAIILALGVSAMGFIPFGDRLVLYLVPLVLLLCTYGIYTLYKWIRKVHRSLAIIFLLILFFLPVVPKLYHLAELTYKVELKSVINYYMENRKEGDKIYLYIDQDTYYPPQFFFYTGENFDFTNMEGSREKGLEELQKEILGNGRVWAIGPLGKLKDYGKEFDHYRIRTLASRWPFKFLREDIINLNPPNAEIRLYDFRQYGLEDLVEQLYQYGNEGLPDFDERQYWVKNILRDPGSIYDLVLEVLVEGKSSSSNKEFINTLYLALLNREPDPGGAAHWISELEEGVTREEAAKRIMYSGEFKAVIQRYGLILD